MKIFNTQVYGIREALIRAGYPMQTVINERMDLDRTPDEKLIKRGNMLSKSPVGHGDDKFLRQITVAFDLKAPRYFWQQFDTYSFVSKNSQSTMHKGKELSYSDLSNGYVDAAILKRYEEIVNEYVENPSEENLIRMKSSMPEGIEVVAGIVTNYAQLRTIYFQRKSHRLPEWRIIFCDWIKSLPHSEWITGEK